MKAPGWFASRMQQIGGFEKSPHLAVAVSGGPDSMALLALAAAWCRDVGGRVTALTVDHGLRAEATREAAGVAAWCQAEAIPHQTLSLGLTGLSGNIQAQARTARYEALEAWCAQAGVLHLLLGHHRDDQADTFLLRLGRGSGLEGLCAMAPESPRPFCRLLRPLLDRGKAALTALVADMPTINDPSNQDRRFARVRVREAGAVLGDLGLTPDRLAQTADHLARAAQVIERAVDRAMLRFLRPHPAGFVWLDPRFAQDEPAEVALRLLARLANWVGGADYPPRFERLDRLLVAVQAGLKGERTLGGALWLPRDGWLLVCREPAQVAPRQPLQGRLVWDGRFSVDQPAPAWSIGALGDEAAGVRSKSRWPSLVLQGLPVLRMLDGSRSVPHLSLHDGQSAPPVRHTPPRRLVEGVWS